MKKASHQQKEVTRALQAMTAIGVGDRIGAVDANRKIALARRDEWEAAILFDRPDPAGVCQVRFAAG